MSSATLEKALQALLQRPCVVDATGRLSRQSVLEINAILQPYAMQVAMDVLWNGDRVGPLITPSGTIPIIHASYDHGLIPPGEVVEQRGVEMALVRQDDLDQLFEGHARTRKGIIP